MASKKSTKTAEQLKDDLGQQLAAQRIRRRTTAREAAATDLDKVWEENGGSAHDVQPSYGIELSVSNDSARVTMEVNELEAEELFRQLGKVLASRGRALRPASEPETQYGIRYDEEPNNVRLTTSLERAKSKVGDPESFPGDHVMVREVYPKVATPWREYSEGGGENKNLDPLPWVHHYDETDRSITDDLPGSLRDFSPRPEYSQNRKDYRR